MRPPPGRLPVPSPGLLRYLRQQSESVFTNGHSYVMGVQGPGADVVHGRRKRQLTPVVDVRARSPREVCVRGAAVSSAAAFSTARADQSWWQAARDRKPLREQKEQKEQKERLRQRRAVPSQGRRPAPGWAAQLAAWWRRGAWRANRCSYGNESRADGLGLLPGDLPAYGAGAEFASVMFNARRLQTAKAALEPRLRCTEVDENGAVILVDGEFKKTELIAKYGLLPRDLRKIDSSNLPHILVRPAAILLNLLHLKVLIKADRVLLFDVYGSKTSYPQSAFMYDLQERLQKTSPSPSAAATSGTSTTLPYEFRALEAVLLSVTSELEAEFDTVREPVLRILSALEEDISRDRLRVLLVLSKKVGTFEQKAKLMRDAIEELLEADDDLAAMYLTEKRHDLFRGEDDHTEVEMLLESYHKICDEVAQEAGSLVSSIRNTEEIIRAILDANRNALMLLDLKFSIGTLGIAMGTFLAGLYGMNLENFIEETNWGFGSITAASAFFSLLVCWYGLVKLNKLQRVSMHGTAGGPGASAPLSGLPGLGSALGGDAGSALTGLPAAQLDARSRQQMRRLGMMRSALMQKKYY